LHRAPRANAKTIDDCEPCERYRGDNPIRQANVRQIQKVSREGHRDRGHPSALNNQQQSPSVDKSGNRVKRLANVCVLPADLRPQRRKLGIDKGSRKRDQSPDSPRAKNQFRRVDDFGDYVRIHENARADDPSHNQHRSIEQTQLAGELCGIRVS